MLTATQMKQDCCGCMACSFSCPKSAISMKEDECGFLYPEINHELCVHCNLCTKVCPLQNTYTGADAVPDIYALQNHQKAIVSESSSGGMFSLLADWTLAQGGVIYGVSFDEGFQVRHMRADSAEKAAAFRTSKYVQSLSLIHISEPTRLGMISYAVFCLKKKKTLKKKNIQK